MPRPRRLRFLVEPSLSLISFSFMMVSPSLLVDDANEVLDGPDHATNGRRIFQRADPVHLVETETDQRLRAVRQDGEWGYRSARP